MKQLFTLLIALGFLVLLIGGCGDTEDFVSSAPESAVDIGAGAHADEETTTTTEKETTTEKDHSTSRRCPLTKPQTTITTKKETTTTTDNNTTIVNCTYPTAPFTIRATVREQDEVFTEKFQGKIITSKAQLDALALDTEYKTSRYTESYFEDKALVVLEFRLTSGSIQLKVNSLGVKSGHTMTVFYTTVRPSPFTNDIACRRILLEVDRSEVENVKTIVGEEKRINSSYSNPTVF